MSTISRFLPARLPRGAGFLFPGVLAVAVLALHLWLTRQPVVVMEKVYREGGLTLAGVGEGNLWQIASYGLLHGSWTHAGVNAAMLYLFARRTVWGIGLGATVKTLIFGVVGGGLCFLAGEWMAHFPQVLVGVSGGTFALLFLQLGVSPDSRMWPLPVSGRALFAGILSALVLLVLIDPVLGIPGFSQIGVSLVKAGFVGLFQTSSTCHLGGALAGMAMARWTLRPRIDLETLRKKRA